MSQIIDGQALALKHEDKLKKQIQDLKIIPHIVSFFNPQDRPSVTFTRLKQNKALELGIVFDPVEINPQVSADLLATLVEGFNKDPNTHGIMFQLPLPNHLQFAKEYLLNLIKSSKDVDGLSGRGPCLQATVRGVLSVLDDQSINPATCLFAVIGSLGMVGKAMVKALETREAKVIKVDRKLPQTGLGDIKDADVVISCTGQIGLIKPKHIKAGAVLIDVGLGDFDPLCFGKAASYTPPQAGVGPMTVISLMENAVDLVLRRSV